MGESQSGFTNTTKILINPFNSIDRRWCRGLELLFWSFFYSYFLVSFSPSIWIDLYRDYLPTYLMDKVPAVEKLDVFSFSFSFSLLQDCYVVCEEFSIGRIIRYIHPSHGEKQCFCWWLTQSDHLLGPIDDSKMKRVL